MNKVVVHHREPVPMCSASPPPEVAPPPAADGLARLRPLLQQTWGFDTLRPLQGEAIAAGIERRDSLVVLPTGGGKSLCYQVPPLATGRTDVVISPLISLMKDQVDGLQSCGYPAVAIHSNLSAAERDEALRQAASGAVRLIFVSPERLLQPSFLGLLERADVSAFAVDEAHCISHWGHDFRPEYRQLATLKQRFPGASVHAFTATATPRVQRDIVAQLGLDDPAVLVGRFDRPNLTFRILPRVDLRHQVREVVSRHRGEAVICYCITRAETERIAAMLVERGFSAAPYHAGMDAAARRETQEAFAGERLDVVVATVAFGMGIDRSNVRCVLHAGMPKSIEHYQQETGRAGRDGLEAECVLLYSPADVIRWRRVLQREGHAASEALAAQLELLRQMQGLCSTARCRHRALSEYFGQAYDGERCDGCDVCLGEVEAMADSTVIAQKILSGVARVGQRFGVGTVVQMLRGQANDQTQRLGHHRLSTFGLLREIPQKALTNLVYQLVDQGVLVRTAGDRPLLKLNEAALAVLRGEQTVLLLQPAVGGVKAAKATVEGWEGVDRELFERLRELRMGLAEERSVPAYVVFGDKTLREMARSKPADLDALREVYGVGERKLADFGELFVAVIREHAASTADAH